MRSVTACSRSPRLSGLASARSAPAPSAPSRGKPWPEWKQPDTPGMPSRPAMSTEKQLLPDPGQPHVLVVDDDPGIRELVSDYLGKNEFRVTAVADGNAMRAALADAVVDLIVLDLRLRSEDGMAIA